MGPQRAVTPAEGQAAPELTPLQHVRLCLRMDEAQSDGDKRPTLVYFHWPHEHPVHGEAVKDMCAKALDDETAARWGRLFRCVQIDMGASDARLLTLLGSDGKPGLVALDAEALVVARIPVLASPTRLAKALQETIRKFPERWKRVQADMADQEKRLESAKRLAKADRLAEAVSEVESICRSPVRVGEAFDEASTLLVDLQGRLERERASGK